MYNAQKYGGKHDFNLKGAGDGDYVITDFWVTDDKYLHYGYGIRGYDIYAHQIGVDASKYRSQNFNLAAYIKNASSDKQDLQYGYYADGLNIYLIFDLNQKDSGHKYESLVIASDMGTRKLNIDDMRSLQKALRLFLTNSTQDATLANSVSDQLPFSSLGELCFTINKIDRDKNGSGYRCDY